MRLKLAIACLILTLAMGAGAAVGSRVFNGSTTQLTTPTNAVYNSLPEFTWATWVRPNSSGAGGHGVLWAKNPAGNGPEIVFGGNPTLEGLVFTSLTRAQSNTTNNVSFGVWTHVVMSFKLAGDAKIHIYFNGVEASYSLQQAATGAIDDDSASGYTFGNDGFGDGFDGNLAEMAEWNVQLTGPEILSVYQSTTGVAAVEPTHLVGYWHLCGIASPEPDATANGNDAVLTVAPAAGNWSPGYACTGRPAGTQNAGRTQIALAARR